jgi:hypothetical protein
MSIQDIVPLVMGSDNCIQSYINGNLILNGECIARQYCPQFSGYYVNMGIIILFLYIGSTWLRKGLKSDKITFKKPDIYVKFWPFCLFIPLDFTDLTTKEWWNSFIELHISLLMAGFIAVMVWLNLRN